MAPKLWLASFLSIFLTGCTVLGELLGNSDSVPSRQATEAQSPMAMPAAKQPQVVECDCTQPSQPVENESGQISIPVKQGSDKEQIQRAQALLKISGSDPGPVDGIIGPRTRNALEQFQSKCVSLNDLVKHPDEKVSQQTIETKASNTFTRINKYSNEQENRRIQTMLKTSGTNPGPIDGKIGPRTRAALRTFYSRCVTVSHLIEIQDWKIVQEAVYKSRPTPALPPEGQTERVVSESSPPAEHGKDDSGKINNSVSQDFTREQVRLVQTRLKASGFDPGPVDGIMGPKTRAALHQELKTTSEY